MPTPIIGLTTDRMLNANGHPVISINEAYVRAVSRAGAAPLLIPLGLPEDLLNASLERVDALIITGGGDIHPHQYGSAMHPKVNEIDPDRDRVEIHLFTRATELGLPFLGICRGLQVINVALGGTLYEDITDQRPGALEHQYYPNWPRDYVAHPVAVAAGSRLAKILGATEAPVNSLHHQGIRELAPAVQAVAHAPDDLVEAIELRDYPYGLAVQWHPEWLPEHAAMRAIFDDLARAAARR